MKKHFKLIALVLAIAMVAVSLCSCRELDAAKEHQAFYTDATENEILYNGNIYKFIKPGNLEFIAKWDYTYSNAYGRGAFVTGKDVPVLLSGWFGDSYTVNDDESLLFVIGKDYVREDKYDEVREIINNSVLDHYYLSYYPISYYSAPYEAYYSASYEGMDIDYYDTDNVSTILLEQDVTDAINKALMTADGDKIQLSEDTLQSVDAMAIERCDQDMMMTTYDNNVVLLRDGESFYVMEDSYYAWNDGYSVCPFDKDGATLIKALFEKYPKAVEQTAF